MGLQLQGPVSTASDDTRTGIACGAEADHSERSKSISGTASQFITLTFTVLASSQSVAAAGAHARRGTCRGGRFYDCVLNRSSTLWLLPFTLL